MRRIPTDSPRRHLQHPMCLAPFLCALGNVRNARIEVPEDQGTCQEGIPVAKQVTPLGTPFAAPVMHVHRGNQKYTTFPITHTGLQNLWECSTHKITFHASLTMVAAPPLPSAVTRQRSLYPLLLKISVTRASFSGVFVCGSWRHRKSRCIRKANRRIRSILKHLPT